MSKLADLRSKGKMVTLSNGLEIEIKPMTLEEEADISEYQAKDKIFKAIGTMVKGAIKRAIPDATDEEIDEINKADLKIITEKVLEVNGLGKDKETKNSKPSQPLKKE